MAKLMAGLDLGKRGALDRPPAAGDCSRMRTAPRRGLRLGVAALLAATPAWGQAAITADLWRVAAGTLVAPAALVADGAAALWTPAYTIPGAAPAAQVSVEAVHAPADAGVGGAIAAFSYRPRGAWTLSAVWGRLYVTDLVRTETSPEALGDIAAYSQVLSLGVARTLEGGALTVGVAARGLSGRLDAMGSSRWTADLGAAYTVGRVTIGAATRFFDPSSSSAESGASYSLGAEVRSSEGTLWGAPAEASLRYGLGLAHGEEASHLVTAGVVLARVFEFDAGAARESVAGSAVWRSRVGAAVSAGRYRVYVGRDGGVNGFGATYRFGLSARVI